MPTYEYQCQDCGFIFTEFQLITDKPITECPHCRGIVRRLIGKGGAVIFRGSGFYCNDYPKDSSTSKDIDNADSSS